MKKAVLIGAILVLILLGSILFVSAARDNTEEVNPDGRGFFNTVYKTLSGYINSVLILLNLKSESIVDLTITPGLEETYTVCSDGSKCSEPTPYCNIEGGCTSEPCVPECGGMECGDDGCGGSCGDCDELLGSGFECGPDGMCVIGSCLPGQCYSSCVPECGGMECGDDGCGGSCGDCSDYGSGFECGPDDMCITGSCIPNCDGKTCGDNGCGGSCGECGEYSICNEQGNCECEDEEIYIDPNLMTLYCAFEIDEDDPCVIDPETIDNICKGIHDLRVFMEEISPPEIKDLCNINDPQFNGQMCYTQDGKIGIWWLNQEECKWHCWPLGCDKKYWDECTSSKNKDKIPQCCPIEGYDCCGGEACCRDSEICDHVDIPLLKKSYYFCTQQQNDEVDSCPSDRPVLCPGTKLSVCCPEGTTCLSKTYFGMSVGYCGKQECASDEEECGVGKFEKGKLCCKKGYCADYLIAWYCKKSPADCSNNEFFCQGVGEHKNQGECCDKNKEACLHHPGGYPYCFDYSNAKDIKENPSQTKSFSVYMIRNKDNFVKEGIAYVLKPSMEFNEFVSVDLKGFDNSLYSIYKYDSHEGFLDSCNYEFLDSTSESIGSGGGSVNLLDEIELTFPTSAVSENTEITIEKYNLLDCSYEDNNYALVQIISMIVEGIVPGDANLDGKVNSYDSKIVSSNWGQTGKTWEQGDFNNDGKVDAADASLMSANWGYGELKSEKPENIFSKVINWFKRTFS
jgi:hypothetical protein